MRAQFLPWPAARAIHSHRATGTRPKTTIEQRDGERGRAEAVPEEPPVDVADDGQHGDQEHRGSDRGAPVHEPDRGQHRRGSGRPQRPGRLAGGRVGLEHGDPFRVLGRLHLLSATGAQHVHGQLRPDRSRRPRGWPGSSKAAAHHPMPRQIGPIWASQLAASIWHPVTQIGGSACVIHSLCCPVGGRPASPRKSHSKSQRGQPSGDSQLRQATVEAGQVPSEPHRATPSDTREVTGGQGVAGSNPAVPTGSKAFSNIFMPHESQ